MTAVIANCSCDLHPHVTEIFGLEVCNLPVVGAWVVAVLIGLFCGTNLIRLGPSVVGSLSYSVSYYTYALMISSGLVVHCLYLVECNGEKRNEMMWTIFAKIDGSLTSCIAISFLFNALIDMKVVIERHYTTYLVMLMTYYWIFYAYFNGHFQSIYLNSICIGCGTYVLIEIYLIIKDKFWKESLFLLPASIVGGGSLLMVYYCSCWLCQKLGAWSIEGLWYYGADVSMAFLFPFVWYTRQRSRDSTKFINGSCEENNNNNKEESKILGTK